MAAHQTLVGHVAGGAKILKTHLQIGEPPVAGFSPDIRDVRSGLQDRHTPNRPEYGAGLDQERALCSR